MRSLFRIAAAQALLLSCAFLAAGCECDDDNLLSGTGTIPSGIALCGHGYAADIDVVDIATMQVLGTITGAGGYRIVITPDGSKAYSTGGDSLVYVSDIATMTLTNSFDPELSPLTGGTPMNPFGVASTELEPIAISPDGSRVYVADEQGANGCYAIDTADDSVVLSTFLAPVDEPENAVVSPDGLSLYICDNTEVHKISTVDLSIVDSAPVGSDAHGVGLSADGARAYAESDTVLGALDVIDTTTMVTTTQVFSKSSISGYYIELGKDGVKLYAVNEGNELYVVDSLTDTLLDIVTLSTGAARGVTTTPDGATILVATSGGLIRLDAATLTETGFLAGSYQSVALR